MERGLRMKNVNFEKDILVAIGAAIFVFLARNMLSMVSTQFFEMLGPKVSNLKSLQRSIVLMTYYSSMVVLGLAVLWDIDWPWDFSMILEVKNYASDSNIFFFKEYYLVALGFYLQELFTLVLLDEKLKDFYVMFSHHVATIYLILISLACGFHRIGTPILLLHYVVDVALYPAKIGVYVGRQMMAGIFYATFVILYFVFRIVVFGKVAYYFISSGITIDAFKHQVGSADYLVALREDAYTPIEVSSFGFCVNKYCVSTWWSLAFSSIALYLMHVYWMILLIDMSVKMIKNGRLDDHREVKKKQ